MRADDADPWAALAVHWDLRQSIIALQADAIGPGAVLLLGDSLIESFAWDGVAGCRLINAGFAGIWTEKLAPRVETLLTLSRPSAVAVLVGTNDADPRKPEQWDVFDAKYGDIVRAIKTRNIPLIVITPPPLEAGKGVASLYSPDRLSRVVSSILVEARRNGAAIIDLNKEMSNADHMAQPGTTADGIHLAGAASRHLRELLSQTLTNIHPPCLTP
ncbi:SGNH/GDSL hydrolase family protein [Rhizobium sp. YAF28]|uniref:SGNH/GDSL hydrolase family protein n=1 Tax=Rhizobium sp. YAF28 TaxID=3233081 RepID=UPI003F9DEDDF